MRVGNLRELQSLACIPFLGILASLQLIDPSVANIALVKASDALQMHGAVLALGASVSTLAQAAAVLMMGFFCDRFGRRRLLAGTILVVAVITEAAVCDHLAAFDHWPRATTAPSRRFLSDAVFRIQQGIERHRCTHQRLITLQNASIALQPARGIGWRIATAPTHQTGGVVPIHQLQIALLGHEGQQQVVQTLPALFDPIGAHFNHTANVVAILKGWRSNASAHPPFQCLFPNEARC